MFLTINYNGGVVTTVILNGKKTITAWCHGEQLGAHYRTCAGAKAAIAHAHKKWLKQWIRKP
jgi:hypothetical protein